MTICSEKSLDLPKLLLAAQLPGLPHSAIKFLELARDDKNGPAEYAVPIEADPGLAAQVLRFVNSAYFGFSNEIASIKSGITLVGVRTIKNFVLWSAIFSLMPNPQCGSFALKILWLDSLRRALFARMVAKLLGRREAEEAFAAALLQDMAVPVLARELPLEYRELFKQREASGRRLSELEQERFGWHHGEAGGIMARQWRLPTEFSILIRNHTSSDLQTADHQAHAFQLAVNLSSLLPSSTDAAWRESSQFERAYKQLGVLNAPSIADLLLQTDAQFEEMAPLLKLQSATKTLLEFHQESQVASD